MFDDSSSWDVMLVGRGGGGGGAGGLLKFSMFRGRVLYLFPPD